MSGSFGYLLVALSCHINKCLKATMRMPRLYHVETTYSGKNTWLATYCFSQNPCNSSCNQHLTTITSETLNQSELFSRALSETLDPQKP